MISVKEIISHEGFRRYFSNTSWLLGEKILRMVVGLFVGIWVARYLGPEQFGLFSYAQSFVGLFATIATFGLDSIIVRELVKNKSRQDLLLGTAFRLKLIGALAVLLILSLAVSFTSNDSQTNFLIIIIASATIFQSFNVIDFYFQSRVQSRYAAFANAITLFISSLVKIVLILIGAPLIAFAWVVMFDSAILSLGFIYFYLKTGKELMKWKFEKEMALSLLKDSWPLIVSGIVISIYMKIDQVMIKEMLGSEAVGQYAAAVRLSEAWYFMPMIIVTSLFPAIINARSSSEQLYYSRLQRLYDFMVWMAITIAIPVSFLSDWIINLLYGSQYNHAGSVLMLLIWAGVFVSFSLVTEKHINLINKQKYTLITTSSGAFINVIFNLFFINSYGIAGAAYSTLLSYAISNYISLFLIRGLRTNFYMINKSFFLVDAGKRLIGKR